MATHPAPAPSLAPDVFGYSDAALTLRDKARDFVDREVIPHETAAWRKTKNNVEHNIDPLDQIIRPLRARARAAGLYAPQLPQAWGGLGLSWRDRALVLEALGRSFLGPLAANCAPPDQPNMINLLQLGTPAQKARYLQPLAHGDIRSCFAMTEPAPGAGSDPSMLQTRAEQHGNTWVLNGHKWFISGAAGTAFAIVLAQTRAGPTLFIVDTDTPGYHFVRSIPSLDTCQIGGHGELKFEDCVLGQDAVLGAIGQGLAYAQARLEPARISHCMRFIGRAARALDIAQEYVKTRQSFGQPLAAQQQIQAMVADAHIDLHASRLMAWHVAALMDTGQPVKQASAMTKVFVAEAVNRVADRAAQMMGALGMSDDTPVAHIVRELRPFRIYDGASEVHRSALARRILA